MKITRTKIDEMKNKNWYFEPQRVFKAWKKENNKQSDCIKQTITSDSYEEKMYLYEIGEVPKPYTLHATRRLKDQISGQTVLLQKKIDEVVSYAETIWNEACEAQMKEVYSHIGPDGNTNGHAIKHWTKKPKMPTKWQSPQQPAIEWLMDEDINEISKAYGNDEIVARIAMNHTQGMLRKRVNCVDPVEFATWCCVNGWESQNGLQWGQRDHEQGFLIKSSSQLLKEYLTSKTKDNGQK